MLGMLGQEQCLGLAVTGLLLEVGPHRGSPVVPDEASRTESDLEVVILQPPAQVNVVPCLAENRIEHPDLLQRPLIQGHVAARNVLGLPIRQHDVSGAAGGHHHRCGHARVFRR